MKIKQSYLAMIKAFPGGWDAIAGALGTSRNSLENRIYERSAREVGVDLALQIQAFSGTTFFAEAVATASNGTFVKLPDDMSDTNDCLLEKSQSLYIELGLYFQSIREATADGVIDKGERITLEAANARVHKLIGELHAMTLRLYTAAPAGEDE